MCLRIMFFYVENWSHEIAGYYMGKVPSHRLFGYDEVKRLGHQSFSCPSPNLAARILSRPIFWRLYQALYAAWKQDRFDCIVATHEAAALPALLLKRMGLLKVPIIVVNVALLSPKNLTGKKRALWRQLLPCAETIISYASAQCQQLTDAFKLDRKRMTFIPLGIDTDFFAPSPAEAGDFLLSVGTNEGKDYATLVSALPEARKLIAITDEHNASVIFRHAAQDQCIEVRQNVPILDLRTLYQRASLHIIPLHETQFSSGQTVLLENMALGKVVIITRTDASVDYVKDGETAICVNPGDVEHLKRTIQAYLDNPQKYRQIGIQATRSVQHRFNSLHCAKLLVNKIEALTLRPRSPGRSALKRETPV